VELKKLMERKLAKIESPKQSRKKLAAGASACKPNICVRRQRPGFQPG
jgi:hypothetical protein